MKTKLLPCLLIAFCLCSCYRQAYFVSPLNGISNPYTTIPLQSDSVKSAFYINNTVSVGSANDQGRDNIFAFQTRLSQSFNFKGLQAYYGVGLYLGNYTLKPYDSLNSSSTINYHILNQYAGSKFFGAAGFNAGINAVVPFDRGGEWRVVGFETFLNQEFGDYLQFRQHLPDSAATYIARKAFFATLDVYTELVDKTKTGSMSFKMGVGTALGRDYHSNIRNSYEFFTADIPGYYYTNFTFQATVKKWTAYGQLCFATKATNALFGFNYRLGK